MTRGRLLFDDRHGVVHMEDLHETDIEDLWSAVTDPARLARWLATVDGRPTVGDRFHAHFTSGWDGVLLIETCDAPNRILVVSNPGESDETTIEAVLTAEGDRTRLVIEERGFSREEIAAHGAGWQAHLEDLSTHLAGGSRSEWEQRWRELIPAYTRLADELA